MDLADLLAQLPSHLAERAHRVLPAPQTTARPEALSQGGGFVLYWMRTAVRGHENPALDTALAASALLGRPLFVYHALSERYPYASDRHHRFILEGARDVQAELGQRNIGYAFHLERPGHRGPHLRSLAQQASLVITEDMPWAPLSRWTQDLATALGRSLLAVDTACVLPARRIGRAWLRAFAFRAATCTERLRRAEQPWTEITPAYPAFVPPLPFVPLPLSQIDLGDAIAACEIDHSVAPVAHTPGGSQAGYARWARFLRDGLPRYAQLRDDPLQPDGSSRMSAYLHYGQVSPLRIARQAASARVPVDSQEKFLDELLTWRELSHVFCTYEPGHETLKAVPDWALKTLRAHEGDRRPLLPSWERLARGETGEPLWDAAQRSLRIHGELHNNLRMTWGKALLGWTPNAQAALSLLIDLNHRYALDGRDPSSYGGILWCLGQFDRPFPPQRPFLGIVRPRSLREHAKKLSPLAYRAQVMQPATGRALRVAILGDDWAGWVCARTLIEHGHSAQIFSGPDKPAAGTAGEVQPAPTFVVHDRRLMQHVASWLHEGVLSLAPAEPGDSPSVQRCHAMGSNGRLADYLGHGLAITRDGQVLALARRDGGFWLKGTGQDAGPANREHGPFDVVLATSAVGTAWLRQAVASLGLVETAVLDGDPSQAAVVDTVHGLGCCHGPAQPGDVQAAVLTGMALAGRVLGNTAPAAHPVPANTAFFP